MLSIVLLFLGHKYPVVYINSVAYVIKKRKNPKFEFTNERLTYFMKFTISNRNHEMRILLNSNLPYLLYLTKYLLYKNYLCIQ